jgi:hypothetical protein
VQDQHGHASIGTTADLYANTLPATRHQAAEATARLLRHATDPRPKKKTGRTRRARRPREDRGGRSGATVPGEAVRVAARRTSGRGAQARATESAPRVDRHPVITVEAMIEQQPGDGLGPRRQFGVGPLLTGRSRGRVLAGSIGRPPHEVR